MSGDLVTAQRHPTAAALLERALEVIEADGEHAVRVEEISSACGVSITSLYHHFGSREGLIEAAQAERFVRVATANLIAFEVELATVSDGADLQTLIGRWVTDLIETSMASARRARTEILASAFTRPNLRDRVVESQRHYNEVLVGILEAAQLRGVVNRAVPALDLTYCIHGITFGRVISEVDPVVADQVEDTYRKFAADALVALLSPSE
jgi:AcrR family transcriptional regulator